nr:MULTISPECIES: hypothetical protein [Paenibacillus]
MHTRCEPCIMCTGAMVWSNSGKVVYSMSHDQQAEGLNVFEGFGILDNRSTPFLVKCPDKSRNIDAGSL